MRVYNIQFLTNQPLNTSFNGMALQLNQMYGYSIQVAWTGNMNSTLSLQASSDPNNTGIEPVNWTTITGSSTSISADGSFMWNVTYAMYNWVRLNVVDSSGGTSTAIMTSARFNGKGP